MIVYSRFVEREVFGAQSIQMARTLKALGSVYLMMGPESHSQARNCFDAALQIFEINPSSGAAVIKDLQHKLGSLISARPKQK